MTNALLFHPWFRTFLSEVDSFRPLYRRLTIHFARATAVCICRIDDSLMGFLWPINDDVDSHWWTCDISIIYHGQRITSTGSRCKWDTNRQTCPVSWIFVRKKKEIQRNDRKRGSNRFDGRWSRVAICRAINTRRVANKDEKHRNTRPVWPLP